MKVGMIRTLMVTLSAVALCGFDACEATVTVPSFDDEDFDPLADWEIDPSDDITTAFRRRALHVFPPECWHEIGRQCDGGRPMIIFFSKN